MAAALLLAASVAILAPAPAAHAQDAKPAPDVLIFTNGDQLTGKLERGVGDSVVFKSDMAGEITVPLAKIKELRSSAEFAVLRKGTPITKTAVPAGLIKLEGDNLVVSTSNAPQQTIPQKDLAFIIDSATYTKELTGHKKLWQGWNGAVTAGATVVRSTQTGTTLTGSVAAVRALPSVPYLPPHSRSIFNLSESYGKLTTPVIPQTVPASPDSVVKTNIFHTDFEQDQYFSPRFYTLETLAFDHNFAQGLNLQQVYGGGVGWTIIQTPKQQLDLTASIHYEKQNFIQPTSVPPAPAPAPISDQNLIGATFGDNYVRHLPGKLLFTQSLTVLPAFNNSNAYSANAAAGLALPVYHRFSVVFNTTDNFLNNPSPGYKKNSYQFITGITYAIR
jgi:hypothetical protein